MKSVLLSFDIEEFDLPRELGTKISLKRGVQISDFGTNLILDILKKNKVKATFFCTTNFAKNAPDTIKRIIKEGHELACHGVDHFHPKPSDIVESKKTMEKLFHQRIYGYRQPRMQKTDYEKMTQIGYQYDSSLNPTFIPGRYNHLRTSRLPFKQAGLTQIPTSVTPLMRIPLFWLALHQFPEKLYHLFVRRVLQHDQLFVVYFHPWEFYELAEYQQCKIPWLIKHNSGKRMALRLEHLLTFLKHEHCKFETYHDYLAHKQH